MNNNNYSLVNTNNYKKKLNYDIPSILDKYLKILIEYLKYVLENNKIKNYCYKKFITIRGLETISYVFNILLYYTNNLEIAYFHSQKAIYFYVEFIQQTSTEENSFLQLSSRDATMYVYRKTIFEINNEYRKSINNELEKEINNELFQKWEIINHNITIMKNILLNIINSKENYIHYDIKLYENVCNLFINNNYTLQKIQLYLLFIKKINLNEVTCENYLYIIELFTKLLMYKNYTDETIKEIIFYIQNNIQYNDKIKLYLENFTK